MIDLWQKVLFAAIFWEILLAPWFFPEVRMVPKAGDVVLLVDENGRMVLASKTRPRGWRLGQLDHIETWWVTYHLDMFRPQS